MFSCTYDWPSGEVEVKIYARVLLLGLITVIAAGLLLGGCIPNGPTSTPIPSGSMAKIAFASGRSGNYDIYLMDTDGSNRTRLTSNPAHDELPSWSPDSAKISFTSDRDSNYEIYVMNADGSNVIRLTNNPAADRNPSWSPKATP